jgi:glycosyltransferase involved in cell wall biosynthesis
MRSAAGNADLVLAISHAAVDELVEHYRIKPDRIRVVPLGVEEGWFAPLPEAQVDALLARRGVRRGSLLFVGTLQPRKNVRTLLEAYDRLPARVRAERQLVIAGKYGWGADELRGDLDARRAAGEVRWLNYVERNELRALYATACAFVFPSLSEGFGLPVLEALAAGTPVIASDLPVLHEVAGAAATFVAPRDVDALAQAMLGATMAPADPAAWEGRRSRARQFDWTTCARCTLDAYRVAASSSRTR